MYRSFSMSKNKVTIKPYYLDKGLSIKAYLHTIVT